MVETKHFKHTYQKEPKKKAVGLGIKIILLAITIGVGGVALVFLYYIKDLPRPERFSEISLSQPTKIYDRTGSIVLYELFGEEKRVLLTLDEIPNHVEQAIIATEDARFYSHFGLDIQGIVRALFTNLQLGSRSQGGSTISQQLIRSSFLSRQKTIERKLREIVLTVELERRYSKDELLEFYLNQVPLGQNAYGIGAGAQLYFDKEAKDLTVEEGAILAAMIQAPTYYSPYGKHTDILFGRKNYVLDRMAQESFITAEEAAEAQSESLVFAAGSTTEIKAPHFVLDVVDELTVTYGEEFLRTNGLKVYTSIDWELQQAAEESMDAFVDYNKGFNAHNAVLVAIRPETGEILALLGSKDWFGDPFPEGCTSGVDCLFDPKVNVSAFRNGRQPGSAFKPFVYAKAFEKGADDETIVIDEETNFGIWGDEEYIPQNYDEMFRGPVTLRTALAQSLNIPSVKVLNDFAGIVDSVALAKEMGLTTLRDPSAYGLSLVLGGAEVYPLDMASAYGVFATGGKRVPPVTILRVEDSKGKTLFTNTKSSIQIMEPAIANLVTDILSDNTARAPLFGTNSALYLSNYKVAAKTGSTQDYRDAWTVGYTPELVVGVWVGNNDNTEMEKAPGIMVASPMWHNFMAKALPYLGAK